MSLIFCLLISLGQLIFAVGYFALRPWIMLTGKQKNLYLKEDLSLEWEVSL